MNSKLKKWRNKIDSIRNDVWTLLNFRSVYSQLNKMLTLDHKKSGNLLFFDFVFYSYAAWACTAIRRLTEINTDGYSLRQLLEDIAKNPSMLSRSYYKEIYSKAGVSQFYNQDFDMFVLNNGEHIDPNDVSLDIAVLNDIYMHFEGFIDKVVVHKDNSLPQTTPSWQDLDDAINTIERITLKYVKAIKAVDQTSLYSETKLNWDEISSILNGLSTQT